MEDKNFYSHYGIDFKSIFRAIVVNIRQGRLTQGASTLTQQLAKNFFLSPDKTLKRKFSEAFVAAAIERQFTKEEILEAYINEVYLGRDGSRGIYGFGLGAQFYFGKSLELLSPKETALLVGTFLKDRPSTIQGCIRTGPLPDETLCLVSWQDGLISSIQGLQNHSAVP